MRSFVTCTVLASVASLAAASPKSSWEYPEGVPLVEKRQDPGTPRYACHENCGTLITLGRTEGYCDTSEWSTRYAACMACANEFGIWMYYGNSVTNAAKECGLTPNPSPSGAPAQTTPAAPPAPTESAPEPVTPSTSAPATPPASEQQQSSAAAPSAAVPSTTAAAVATTLTTATATGSAAASGSAASGTSVGTVTRPTSIGTSVVIPSGSPTPSTVFAGASKNSGVLGALGVVGLVLAAL